MDFLHCKKDELTGFGEELGLTGRLGWTEVSVCHKLSV